MTDDIFDVVDQFDTPTGIKLPRTQVHAQGLMHRAVHVLIFRNRRTEILLQMRSRSKDSYPLYNTTACSGHVDAGESYEVAVERELREETGLCIASSAMQSIGRIPACPQTGMEFTQVYALDVDPNQKFKFSPDEIDGFEWIKVEDFERMLKTSGSKITPSFAKVYKFYLSKLEK